MTVKRNKIEKRVIEVYRDGKLHFRNNFYSEGMDIGTINRKDIYSEVNSSDIIVWEDDYKSKYDASLLSAEEYNASQVTGPTLSEVRVVVDEVVEDKLVEITPSIVTDVKNILYSYLENTYAPKSLESSMSLSLINMSNRIANIVTTGGGATEGATEGGGITSAEVTEMITTALAGYTPAVGGASSSIKSKTFLNRSSGDVLTIDTTDDEGYPVVLASRVVQAGDVGVINASHEFSNAHVDNFLCDLSNVDFEEGLHNIKSVSIGSVKEVIPGSTKSLFTYDIGLLNDKFKIMRGGK